MVRILGGLAVCVLGCGDEGMLDPGGDPPVMNLERAIESTELTIDVTALTGTAVITFAASETPGASLEIGDMTIDDVDVPFADTGARLDLAVPAATTPTTVTVTYEFKHHETSDGASAGGYTVTWPISCGNFFPCHSNPAHGSTYTLALTGVPVGQVAVYPPSLPKSPAYIVAWAIDGYVEQALGATAAGTNVSVWAQPGDIANAQMGAKHLVAAFDWFERTLGAYTFGNKVGSVATRWRYNMIGNFGLGGMEHHPYWHIFQPALAFDSMHLHEASHGWYGNGVRIACWEDMLLSEGTATYLTARVLDVIAPTEGAALFMQYETELQVVTNTDVLWPRTACNTTPPTQVINQQVYVRGALFYRALARKLGADTIDQVLAAFYQEHKHGAARFSDMLTKIQAMTGYDPTACMTTWLRTSAVPTDFTCP